MKDIHWPSQAHRDAYHARTHVELHRHLVGGMRPERAAELARRRDPATHLRDAGDVIAWWKCANLDEFVTRYLDTIALIGGVEDIETLARDLVEDLERERIEYAEITYLPARLVRAMGFPFDEVADALRGATAVNGTTRKATVRFLMDLVRELPPEVAAEMIELGKRYLPDLIVGVDLGGREHIVAPQTFIDVYRLAREAGYACVAHAGETQGADSIRSVVADLDVARVQHGVRCLEDPSLVALLRDSRMPLAVCPTSNVRLGVFSRYEDVPVRRMLDEGLCVTLNTDDPGMFDTTLEAEFAMMARVAPLSPDEIGVLHDNAMAARLLYRNPQAKTPTTRDPIADASQVE